MLKITQYTLLKTKNVLPKVLVFTKTETEIRKTKIQTVKTIIPIVLQLR